jgi:hypothetical protein
MASASQQEILLKEPQAGTYYLLIHGRENAGVGVPFTLQLQDLFFRSISPVRGGNNGSTTITLNGAGFTPDAVVELVAPDNSTRAASRLIFKDDNTISATCDLTGLAPAVYDVRVTFNGTTQMLADSFTVFASTNPGRVEVTLDSPSSIRPGREGTLTINYVNVGDTDAVAPLIDLTSDRAEFRPGWHRPVRLRWTGRSRLSNSEWRTDRLSERSDCLARLGIRRVRRRRQRADAQHRVLWLGGAN